MRGVSISLLSLVNTTCQTQISHLFLIGSVSTTSGSQANIWKAHRDIAPALASARSQREIMVRLERLQLTTHPSPYTTMPSKKPTCPFCFKALTDESRLRAHYGMKKTCGMKREREMRKLAKNGDHLPRNDVRHRGQVPNNVQEVKTLLGSWISLIC